MDEKTRLQVICLQVLSLVSLFLGRLPKVQTVVDILTHVVTEHWDELFSLTVKKAAGKKLITQAKKELAADPKDGGRYLSFGKEASKEVRDVLERVEDEFGGGGNTTAGDGTSGHDDDKEEESEEEPKSKKGGGQFRH